MPREVRDGEVWIATDTEPVRPRYGKEGSLRLRAKPAAKVAVKRTAAMPNGVV